MILFRGGIVDLNVYEFFDFPGEAILFPAYYAEVVHSDLEASGVLVAMYG